MPAVKKYPAKMNLTVLTQIFVLVKRNSVLKNLLGIFDWRKPHMNVVFKLLLLFVHTEVQYFIDIQILKNLLFKVISSDKNRDQKNIQLKVSDIDNNYTNFLSDDICLGKAKQCI